MKFQKPSLPIAEQINLLKQRGMIVDDVQSAEHHLNFISYYRLRAYWALFEKKEDERHLFNEGTRFEDVLTLYFFDRDLRVLIFDAIERVEIALRTQWVNHMGLKYGPHGYLDQKHYRSDKKYEDNVEELKKNFSRSNDTFAKHYSEKYGYSNSSPDLPPVWIAAEIMSLGLLSKFYDLLKKRPDKQAIAKPFHLDEKIMASFVRHVNNVRNVCAHHGRLWNKDFTVRMNVLKSPVKLNIAMEGANKGRLHNTLVMLDYLLNTIEPQNKWKEHLIDLIDNRLLQTPASIASMGFPDDWRTRAIWK